MYPLHRPQVTLTGRRLQPAASCTGPASVLPTTYRTDREAGEPEMTLRIVRSEAGGEAVIALLLDRAERRLGELPARRP